jgi:toxin ParE1/3/4
LIYGYLENRGPQGARNLKIAIVHAVRSLASQPQLGRLTDRTDVHELILPRLPYKVYYHLEREELWILHIRDARRRSWEGEGD